MQAERRTYALAAVLVVAVIVLIVDRAMKSGPESASAIEITRPIPEAGGRKLPPAAAPGAGGPAAKSSEPGSAGEDWLRRLPDEPEVRDLFRSLTARPEADGSAAHDTPDPVERFCAAHRLEATFQDGGVGCAVVNGRVVRGGQNIGGFRLVAVDAFRAVFRRGRLEAVLTMDVPASSPETRASDGG